MKRWASLICASAFVLGASLASAQSIDQSIDIERLDSAAPFQPGVLEAGQGGLDSALWQGTSAELATYLIEKSPVKTQSTISHDLLEAALLSSGVPPEAESEDNFNTYRQARFSALMKMGHMAAVQQLAQNGQDLSRDPALLSDMHLIAGDFSSACRISDSISEGRGESDWVALRGFCHVVRDEVPAADLAVDLLKGREDFDDQTYFSLMRYLSGTPGAPNLKGLTNSPQHIALMNAAGLDWPNKSARPAVVAARIALDPIASPEDRLAALWQAGPALSDAQITSVLDDLIPVDALPELEGAAPDAGLTIRTETYDLDAALQADAPEALGRLFDIVTYGNPQDRPLAIYEILSRAAANSAFERFATLLGSEIQAMSAADQMQLDLPLFARAAMMRRDISFFQQVFMALDGTDAPQQPRIALAADALGNGFFAGELGVDIDTRLEGDNNAQRRARRDALIAHAMGANMSDEALKQFDGIVPRRPEIGGEIVGLISAAKNQSRAETALWTARILDQGVSQLDDMSLHTVISALNEAGMSEFAGRVAAEDFLDGMESLPKGEEE